MPPYAGVVDENQRYTTDEADAWLRSVAGVEGWDLDVAACRESHRAPFWYGLDHGRLDFGGDGLRLGWGAGRVFCNPPWDNIEPWLERAWQMMGSDIECEVIGFLLPGGRTHRPWWQKWVEPFREGRDEYGEGWPLITSPPAGSGWRPFVETYNPPKRFSYGCPGNPRGVGMPEPNFTTVGLVFGRR